MTYTQVPIGFPHATALWAGRQQGLLEEITGDDLNIKIKQTFKGPTLFASGQSDAAHFTHQRAAEMAQEQDMELTVFGKTINQPLGFYTKSGGPYDPAETGGVQASLDKLVENDGKLGIPGWGSGAIPCSKRIFSELYGYTLAQDGGDFNVFDSSWGSMAKELNKQRLDVSITAANTSPTPIMNDDLTQVYYHTNVYGDEGWGPPPVGNLVADTSFIEEYPEAAMALVKMWSAGQEIIHNSPEEITGTSEGREVMDAPSQEAAEFLVTHYIDLDADDNPFDYQVLFKEAGLTDDVIESYKNQLAWREEAGLISSQWRDRLQFLKVEDIESMM